MNKRINNAKGTGSKNRGPARHILALSIKYELHRRTRQAAISREQAAQSTRQKVKIEKRGWKDKTRSFFSGVFKQGQRGR